MRREESKVAASAELTAFRRSVITGTKRIDITIELIEWSLTNRKDGRMSRKPSLDSGHEVVRQSLSDVEMAQEMVAETKTIEGGETMSTHLRGEAMGGMIDGGMTEEVPGFVHHLHAVRLAISILLSRGRALGVLVPTPDCLRMYTLSQVMALCIPPHILICMASKVWCPAFVPWRCEPNN